MSDAQSGPESVIVTPCPDGPLLVRGPVLLASEPGATPEPPTRRVVALCRCGASARAPFCDGSHKVTGFKTSPVRAQEPRD